MAWLELAPSGVYKVAFRFDGRKLKRSLETDNPQLAERSLLRVEENLRLVEQGRLDVPAGVDPAEFLLYDGKLAIAAAQVAFQRLPLVTDGKTDLSTSVDTELSRRGPFVERPPQLRSIYDEYLSTRPINSLSTETVRVARVHMNRLCEILGESIQLSELNKSRLQYYVTQRGMCKGKRGQLISPTTIKKELGTLSTVWTWARGEGYVDAELPSRDLVFSTTADRSPFQTRRQIERQIGLGGLSTVEEEELWDSLFLLVEEVAEVLTQIATYRGCGFLYPMAVMAAHSGARRSELCRSRVSDFDFDGPTVRLHEKKRVKGKLSSRRVPMSQELQSVMREWFERKRSSHHAFPREHMVQRNRRLREVEDAASVDEASHHLARSLANSRWEKIRGWHIFRHSFCSNCAAAGVDQRIINEWTGHTTDDMVRRYRHLIPDQEQAAISRVFS